MLRIFRQIRLKFIEHDKIKKYLIYAFGEIVLIVIGILIAFQINVWKENRNNATLQLAILKEIHADVSENINKINEMLIVDSATIENNLELLRILKDTQSVYNDSMAVMFGKMSRFLTFYPLRLGYESLKSKGLDLLTNDSLRHEIAYLYDVVFGQNETYSDGKRKWHEISNDMTMKHLETGSFLFVRRPNNFLDLKKNHEFINYLTLTIARTDYMLNQRYKPVILPKTMQLKKALEKEIEKIED